MYGCGLSCFVCNREIKNGAGVPTRLESSFTAAAGLVNLVQSEDRPRVTVVADRR